MMDPRIKLFGQTISFAKADSSQDHALDVAGTTSTGEWEQSSCRKDAVGNGVSSFAGGEPTRYDESGRNYAEEEQPASSPSEFQGIVGPRMLAGGNVTQEDEDMDLERAGFGNADGSIGQEVGGDEIEVKGLTLPRRPDKGVSCPRCHSLETKFCYYNNYNVNQPRHFCKHCQRYWTAGGTLRNVPVGAGRRKNKHVTVISTRHPSDGALVRSDAPDPARPLLVGKAATLPVALRVPGVPPSGLAGSLAPFCAKSFAISSSDSNGFGRRLPTLETTCTSSVSEATLSSDVVSFNGQPPPSPLTCVGDVTNGISKMDETGPSASSVSCESLPDMKCEPSASSKPQQVKDVIFTSLSAEDVGRMNSPGLFGFYTGGWPYGYSVGWNGGAALSSSAGRDVSAAGSVWTGVPWPMPGLAWSPTGWGPPWPIAPWAMGPATPGGGASAALAQCLHPTKRTTYGYMAHIHASKDASSSSPVKQGRSFWGTDPVEEPVRASKSLRIADTEEAMKSSVWRLMGNGDRQEEPKSSSTFIAFRPKTESQKSSDDDQQAAKATLHANPAAMSRSIYFHESN